MKLKKEVKEPKGTKVKLNTLLNAKNAIEKLMKQDLPVMVSFKISQFCKRYNKEYTVFIEKKKKLFEEYGEEKEGRFKIKEENSEQFNEDIKKLLNTEVTLEIEKIKLVSLATIQLSPMDLNNLEILIEE